MSDARKYIKKNICLSHRYRDSVFRCQWLFNSDVGLLAIPYYGESTWETTIPQVNKQTGCHTNRSKVSLITDCSFSKYEAMIIYNFLLSLQKVCQRPNHISLDTIT